MKDTMPQDLCTAIAAHSFVTVHGGRTKNALLGQRVGGFDLDLTTLSGIITYDPSEFLITARAGTRISALVSALAEHGQYLPFDPVMITAGATLGGTIASGISGANRMLYGGLRDFVMEVELIDGLGRLVRGGGKVVKNSAGFDLPKLMVGSYGRLGVLTEATLKVFPEPATYVTQRFAFASMSAAVAALQKLQSHPLPISAIEIEPKSLLVVRYAGREEALGTVAARAEQLLGHAALERIASEAEEDYWNKLSDFKYVPGGSGLVRIAMSSRKLMAVEQVLQDLQNAGEALSAYRYSAGASVAWLAVGREFDYQVLDERLSELRLSGIVVRDDQRPRDGLTLLGDKSWVSMSGRIQKAMDPEGRFPGFDYGFAHLESSQNQGATQAG